MTFSPSRRLLPLALLALASSACAINLDAARFTDKEERRFPVNGPPDVVLSTFDGAVDVRGWERPEVLVTVEKHADSEDAAKEIKVTFDQTGNRVTVRVEAPNPVISINSHRSANVTISMPRDGNLQAKSGDGSIAIAGLHGTVNVSSGDGSIKGTDLDGDLAVHTGDGSVTLEDVKGRLELTTGDGAVSVRGALSRLKARTGDGPITVRALSGSTTAEDWELTSGDGAMTVELPPDFAAQIDAHTGDGGIVVDGLTLGGAQFSAEHRDDLKGTLGSGGKMLKLRTGDGSIRLKGL